MNAPLRKSASCFPPGTEGSLLPPGKEGFQPSLGPRAPSPRGQTHFFVEGKMPSFPGVPRVNHG